MNMNALIARETLIAETHKQSLANARDRIREMKATLTPRAAEAEFTNIDRKRLRLEQKFYAMEERASETERANNAIATQIDNLRRQGAPWRERSRRIDSQFQQRARDNERLKQQINHTLDSRDGLKHTIARLQEEALRETNSSKAQQVTVREKEVRLYFAIEQAKESLEAGEELAKRIHYEQMRSKRTMKERSEVQFGYLRAQLTALDEEFCKLLSLADGGMVTGDEAVRIIIERQREREERNRSMQEYWAELTLQIDTLNVELSRLKKERLDFSPNEDDESVNESVIPPRHISSHTLDVDTPDQSRNAEELAFENHMQQVFKIIDSLMQATRSDSQSSLHGVCSVSTVEAFLAELASRLDVTDSRVARLIGAHELILRRRRDPKRSVRPPSYVLERYHESRNSIRALVPHGSNVNVDEAVLPSVADLILDQEDSFTRQPRKGRGARNFRAGRYYPSRKFDARLEAAIARRRPPFVTT